MRRSLFVHPAALLVAALVCVACLTPAAPAAAEGYGIESMTAKDWQGMWGFQKRGFAECWLAGKRHQAARTAAELTRLQQQLAPQGAACASVQSMQAELRAILDCRLTPSQLEESVNRFYGAPGNSKVLLGDALHFVVLGKGRSGLR